MHDPNDISGTRRAELNGALEHLHFAFRAVVARPDAVLAKRGLSRVHHRILYFINRHPDLSVNDLLAILSVSKQALNTPMRQLSQRGLVASSSDKTDRRIKRLRLTKKGQALENTVSGDQRERFARVFARVGGEKEDAWREVMRLLAEEQDGPSRRRQR